MPVAPKVAALKRKISRNQDFVPWWGGQNGAVIPYPEPHERAFEPARPLANRRDQGQFAERLEFRRDGYRAAWHETQDTPDGE